MSTPQYIQGPDGRMRGSRGAGRDTVPAPAVTPAPGQPADNQDTSSAMRDLLAHLASLPGLHVADDDAWEDTLDATMVMHLADSRRARDEGFYGPGAGLRHMTADGRCARCESRYCVDGCHAGEPGFVYVVGRGHLTFDEAEAVEQSWVEAGLVPGVDFGPEHGTRRVEWAPGHYPARYAASAGSDTAGFDAA